MGIDTPRCQTVINLEADVLREAFNFNTVDGLHTLVHQQVKITAGPAQLPRWCLLLFCDGICQHLQRPAHLLSPLSFLLRLARLKHRNNGTDGGDKATYDSQ